MPILTSDIKFKLSGGATNTVGNDALGGDISTTDASTSLNGLFDYVTGAEAAAGDVEYRCIYVLNNHATLPLYSAKIWISANTPSSQTTVDIALGSSATGASEQVVANESTAPTGVSFSSPADEASALAMGDIPAQSFKAVWVRRTVDVGAAAYNNDGMTLSVKGDSGA